MQDHNSAASWIFQDDDSVRVHDLLGRFLRDSGARTALLVDRAGQMLVTAGQPPAFDPTAFASLTAADFSANDQLARLLGEPEFGTLFHQGEKESLYLADVARRVILVVLFDSTTTLGLVKLRARNVVVELAALFTAMFARDTGSEGRVDASFVAEAGDELDKLFGA